MTERREQRLVQQLVTKSSVEALDEGVLLRFARSNIVPFDPCLLRQRKMAMLVNSVPLSLTIVRGGPRRAITVSSSRPTLAPESEVSATNAMHSLVKSSTTTAYETAGGRSGYR
jgi:hypothetical protein